MSRSYCPANSGAVNVLLVPKPPESADGRRLSAAIAATFVVAIVLRVVFVLQSRDAPWLGMVPGFDLQTNWEAARWLTDGGRDGPGFEIMSLSAPLHTLVTAAIRRAVGDSETAHRLVWATLSSFRYPLMLLVALRASRSLLAATVAVLLIGTLPSLILADTMLGKLSLDLSILTALVFAICWFETRIAKPTRAALGGVILGGLLSLAFLSQVNSVLWVAPTVIAILASSTARLR